MGSVGAGTLRSVLAANEHGHTSVVVSYRADGVGPEIGNGRSTLGYTEADDAAAAIEYAIQHAGRRIVLFGRSMGAAIALQLAHHPSYRGSIWNRPFSTGPKSKRTVPAADFPQQRAASRFRG